MMSGRSSRAPRPAPPHPAATGCGNDRNRPRDRIDGPGHRHPVQLEAGARRAQGRRMRAIQGMRRREGLQHHQHQGSRPPWRMGAHVVESVGQQPLSQQAVDLALDVVLVRRQRITAMHVCVMQHGCRQAAQVGKLRQFARQPAQHGLAARAGRRRDHLARGQPGDAQTNRRPRVMRPERVQRHVQFGIRHAQHAVLEQVAGSTPVRRPALASRRPARRSRDPHARTAWRRRWPPASAAASGTARSRRARPGSRVGEQGADGRRPAGQEMRRASSDSPAGSAPWRSSRRRRPSSNSRPAASC